MASARQIAANRRNAQKACGPVTEEGKQRSSMHALKHGMTARVLVLPHEDEIEYHEIRAALLESYAPANAHETMLVDGIAAGYWRTLRARRFETALLAEGARTYKQNHGKSTEPNAGHDDSVCVWMVQMPGEKLKNYFRYDGSIERQYYRAIAALEKAQAARFRGEQQLERTLRNASPDTIAETCPEPPPPTSTAQVSENGIRFLSSQQDESCKAATPGVGVAGARETARESSSCILEKSDAAAGSDDSIALRPCCSVVPASTPKCHLDLPDSDRTREFVSTSRGA